jgi:hypothetical protein
VSISHSTSNLVIFSEQLNEFAAGLSDVVVTNRESIAASVKNIESSTIVLKNLMQDVKAGKGLVGKLMTDEKTASNIAEIAYNLSITTSNLNQKGLWGILWSKKVHKTDEPPARALQSPKGKSD